MSHRLSPGKRSFRLLAALLSGLLLAPASARADAEGDLVRSLLDRHGSAIVSIQFVLVLQAPGLGDEERVESEINGVLIDAEGLVLCANSQLGGLIAPLLKMMGGGNELTATPTEIKVLVDSQEGLDAELVARDSELDLAWIRILDKGERKLSFLDFEGAPAELEVGETFYTLQRMSKMFDRAPLVGLHRVGGETQQPRRLFVPATPLAMGFGYPVFDSKGELAGITALQYPEGGTDLQTNPLAALGQRAGLEQALSGLVLPASEVRRATAAARQLASEGEEEEEALEGEAGEKESAQEGGDGV